MCWEWDAERVQLLWQRLFLDWRKWCVMNTGRQQPTTQYVCLWWFRFVCLVIFFPLLSDPGQRTIDWRWIRKVKIIYDSVVLNWYRILFRFFPCGMLRMEQFSLGVLSYTHISISFQLSFLSTFRSIWLINLFILDAASRSDFCGNANFCARCCEQLLVYKLTTHSLFLSLYSIYNIELSSVHSI